MVAEDELPILRGIKNMIENNHAEFTVVKSAYNGREAIEYLKNNPVDVIFTDINMPLVNGMEVLEFASQKYPDCMKVIISGYNEFQYAQQAIHLGVKEYLLKPIVYDDLQKILNNILAGIEEKREKSQKSLLKSVVYEGNKSVGTQKVQMVHFCAGPLIKEGLEESVEECDFWKGNDIESTALKFLPKEISVYAFEKYQPNERILLTVSKEKVHMKNFCIKVIEEMEKVGICLTAVFHQKEIDMQDIPSMSRQLRKCMRDHILLGESCAFEDEDLLKENSESAFLNRFTGKENAMIKEAELIFSYETLKQKDCVYLLENLLKQVFPDSREQVENNEDTIWNLILYSVNGKELFHNLMQILEEKGIYDGQVKTKELIEHVDHYVQKHFSEDITVASVADKFGLVPPYLSRLFKEYSGYTLSQYIQKIRIDRAKKLLEMEGEILAKDVAEIVGYPNPLYFSKIFKKKVGMYPSDYRKQMKAKSEGEEYEV